MDKTTNRMRLIDSFEIFHETGKKWEVFEVSESEQPLPSVVDGVSILGRAVGPFFLVDGISRNGRFYSRRLWERAIQETADVMQSGLMLGTIGHEVDIDDKALREGIVSHIIRRLWIEDIPGKPSVGMGELLIINTPAGMNLNTYLRSGAQLPVSSRAFGRYTGSHYQDAEVIDPDTFELKTFDYVTSPGVESAIPRLVESTKEVQEERIINAMGNSSEEKTLLESMTREKIFAEQKLAEALEANRKLQELFASQETQLTLVKEKIAKYESIGAPETLKAIASRTSGLVKKYEDVTQELKETRKQLRQYQRIGTARQFEAVVREGSTLLDKYERLGTPAKINKSMMASYRLLREYAKLGGPKQIQTVFRLSEQLLKRNRKLGTTKQLTTALRVLESYTRLGTPMQIKRNLRAGMHFSQKILERYNRAVATKLSKRYGIPVAAVQESVQKLGATGAENLLKGMIQTKAKSSLTMRDRYAMRETYKGSPRSDLYESFESDFLSNRIPESKEEHVKNPVKQENKKQPMQEQRKKKVQRTPLSQIVEKRDKTESLTSLDRRARLFS